MTLNQMIHDIALVEGWEVYGSQLFAAKTISSVQFLQLCSRGSGIVYLADGSDEVPCYFAVSLSDCPTLLHRWLLALLPTLYPDLRTYRSDQDIDANWKAVEVDGANLIRAFRTSFSEQEVLGSSFREIKANAREVTFEEMSSHLHSADCADNLYFFLDGQGYRIPDAPEVMVLFFKILAVIHQDHLRFFIQAVTPDPGTRSENCG